MEINLISCLILLFTAPIAFVLSSAAGLGGSLILVPVLILTLGVKEGITMAALLLAVNNLIKLWFYRKTLPVRESLAMVLTVIAGAAIGSTLMVHSPIGWVKTIVSVALLATLAVDILPTNNIREAWAGLLALFSGATSGFAGTSGPLQGLAIRSLGLKRQSIVGAVSVVSLAAEATKAIIFSQSGYFGKAELITAAALTPIMIACTLLGRKINLAVGEKGYTILFWTVMAGYTARLLFDL